MKKNKLITSFISEIPRARILIKEKGVIYLVKATFHMVIINQFKKHYYRIVKKNATFKFEGEKIRYFYDNYKTTWASERAVEIPIIWRMVKPNLKKDVLEVGNVLSHYFPVKYDIIDKYEKAKGVKNIDVVDFNPKKRYDLIVSISTLEHVGIEENPKKPEKILDAIKQLKKLLKKDGTILVTLPLAYNKPMDKMIADGRISFHKKYCMKRVSKNNTWKQTSYEDIKRVGYDVLSARGFIIGEIKK